MKLTRFLIGAVLLINLTTLSGSSVFAAVTTPATIGYQGRLLNASNVALTGTYNFRFSMWTDAEYTSGVDDDGAGTINTLDGTYAGWQETHTVTVGSYGLFDIDLGSVTPLPNFTAGTHAYLQVEVKLSTNPITAFEVLDPAGTLADTTDRKKIHDQAYAENADTLDNAEIGTGVGNIAVLSAGGVWDISLIPAGTNANNFVIDNNNDAVDPYLQFSTTGTNRLSFVNASDWFNFNNDVNIAGGLYINGTLIQLGSAAPNLGILNFHPAYPDTVVFLDGTNNIGTIVTGYDDTGTENENYYNFTSGNAAQQDQDLKFHFVLPGDFATTGDFTFRYQTGTLVDTDNDVEIYVYNATDETAGDPTLCGSDTTNVSATWVTETITAATLNAGCTGGTALNAGDIIEVDIKLLDNSGAPDFARIGSISLDYNN